MFFANENILKRMKELKMFENWLSKSRSKFDFSMIQLEND